MQNVRLVVAVAMGGLIAFVDSRPDWDDTGVTAFAVLISSGVLGFLGPKRPWLWALAIGLWIPLLGIIREQNFGTLIALVLAFVGAYVGMAIRRGTRQTA